MAHLLEVTDPRPADPEEVAHARGVLTQRAAYEEFLDLLRTRHRVLCREIDPNRIDLVGRLQEVQDWIERIEMALEEAEQVMNG